MYKLINKLLIIIMLLITFLTALSNPNRIISYILILPTLYIPYIIKDKLKDKDITIYYIFIFIAQILGTIFNFYNNIWWYDILVHFLSGFLTFYLGLIIIRNMNIKINNKLFIIIFCICFSSLVASLWEILEFTIDIIFNLNIQHSIDTGVKDTMEDIIVALISSSIFGLIYYRNKKIHK